MRRAYQLASPRLRHGGDVGDDRINVGIGHQLGVGGHERIGAHALAHAVAFECDRQVLGLLPGDAGEFFAATPVFAVAVEVGFALVFFVMCH